MHGADEQQSITSLQTCVSQNIHCKSFAAILYILQSIWMNNHRGATEKRFPVCASWWRDEVKDINAVSTLCPWMLNNHIFFLQRRKKKVWSWCLKRTDMQKNKIQDHGELHAISQRVSLLCFRYLICVGKPLVVLVLHKNELVQMFYSLVSKLQVTNLW